MIFYNPVLKLANILDGLLLALRLISQLMSLHISAQIKPSAGAHTHTENTKAWAHFDIYCIKIGGINGWMDRWMDG